MWALSRAGPNPHTSLVILPGGLHSDVVWPYCFLNDTMNMGLRVLPRVVNAGVLEAQGFSTDHSQVPYLRPSGGTIPVLPAGGCVQWSLSFLSCLSSQQGPSRLVFFFPPSRWARTLWKLPCGKQ